MHHKLKIDHPFYVAVKEGRKTFEIRYNDRGYNTGDTVTLIPHKNHTPMRKEPIEVEITYVSNYHQQADWVVFSFKIIT